MKQYLILRNARRKFLLKNASIIQVCLLLEININMSSVRFKIPAILKNGHIFNTGGNLPLSGNIRFIYIGKILRKINFKQVCQWIKESWSGMRVDIIVKSFKKGGISRALDDKEYYLIYEENNQDDKEEEEKEEEFR